MKNWMMTTLCATCLLGAPQLATAGDCSSGKSGKDIVSIAMNAGSFKTLAAALNAADLVSALQGEGPFTVFAPTDEAFAKLPKGTLETLLKPENKDMLTAILTYHVIGAKVSASDAIKAGSAKTLQGTPVTARIVDGRLTINESTVVKNDIAASNGVIHVIDSVLIPEKVSQALSGRKVIGVFTQNPNATLRAQLGLDKGTGFVITGFSKNGRAEEAGLAKYDVVVEIAGHPATERLLREAKEEAGVGGMIDMTVIRAGRRVSVHVPVATDNS